MCVEGGGWREAGGLGWEYSESAVSESGACDLEQHCVLPVFLPACLPPPHLAANPPFLQAVSTLVEHSGCDVRTAINTLQLLARQQQQHNTTTGASSQHNQQHHASSSSTQRRPLRVRITAGDIAASGAFGVKDVAHTPMGVVQEVLAANSSRAMAARLQHLAAAMRADGGRQQQQQQGGAGYGRSSSSRRGGGAGGGSVPLSAAAAARLALQEHYSMLLDLGEHEQVSVCVWRCVLVRGRGVRLRLCE